MSHPARPDPPRADGVGDAAKPFAWREVRWIEAGAGSDGASALHEALQIAGGPAPGADLRRWLTQMFARADTSDATILEFALELEQLGAAFYPEAERLGASRVVRPIARLLASQEQAHVGQLFDLLGRPSDSRLPQQGFSFRWTGARGFVSIAVALEVLSAATYEVARSFLVQPEARLVARRLEILEAHHEQLVARLAEVERDPGSSA
ncbi:MAG: ferritin-like domain-containing protein [Solirubrobacterales bacterium]